MWQPALRRRFARSQPPLPVQPGCRWQQNGQIHRHPALNAQEMGYNHAAPKFFHAPGHPMHKKQYLASPVHQRYVVDDQNVHGHDEIRR
ncbi:Uncharacterised protein [Shigella sonnei]|nr:Uncharacterised protein [Shigella sonnei]